MTPSMYAPAKLLPEPGEPAAEPSRWWGAALALYALGILFADLGGAALFEPDEGRNAEVAREILLLKDWITPHYDFIPRLDKPIFFFDLVALSLKLFGVSEWAARLPSVVAALVCLLITYRLASSLFGRRAGLWSALILLTSSEFFALSRLVIMDMTLTCFVTLALWGFHLGQRGVAGGAGMRGFLLMYVAMGLATAMKGPVGLVLPAAAIGLYLLLSRRWDLMRQMQIPLGIALFLLVVLPWYLVAEARNPGYLRYFLWEENFHRFTTPQFKRSGAWYYYAIILSAGFFPWTILLPAAAVHFAKCSIKGEMLLLSLWVALPLLFFSLSSSKLPHYILPVFPPLAIIVGAAMANMLADSAVKLHWIYRAPALVLLVPSSALALAALWPEILPALWQPFMAESFPQARLLFALGLCAAAGIGGFTLFTARGKEPEFLFAATACGFGLLVLSSNPLWVKIAARRSSKQLVAQAAPSLQAGDRLMLYGGYPSSLPFYLNIQRPMGVLWTPGGSKVLGSDYVARLRPEPAAGYGKVLYCTAEFDVLWKTAPERLVVFGKNDGLQQLTDAGGAPAALLAQGREISVVVNR